MRADGAYWRRVQDFSKELKDNIDTERRFTRMLDEHAVAGAAAYGKSFDRVKREPPLVPRSWWLFSTRKAPRTTLSQNHYSNTVRVL